jgi:hypothetical protein
MFSHCSVEWIQVRNERPRACHLSAGEVVFVKFCKKLDHLNRAAVTGETAGAGDLEL